MAARTQKLIALIAVALCIFVAGRPTAQTRTPESAPKRIVSLVPAITEMLFAIGAGPQVVAVSSFDEFPVEVKSLPKVGALLDPDTERILAMRPDLVIVYGSQSDLQTQLERAGLRTFSYRHGGLATTLGTIRDVGIATGHRQEAEAGRYHAQGVRIGGPKHQAPVAEGHLAVVFVAGFVGDAEPVHEERPRRHHRIPHCGTSPRCGTCRAFPEVVGAGRRFARAAR